MIAAGNEDPLEPGNEDVRIEDVDVDVAVNRLQLICEVLAAGNEDTLEPGNEDVRKEDVDVDVAANGLELICVLPE